MQHYFSTDDLLQETIAGLWEKRETILDNPDEKLLALDFHRASQIVIDLYRYYGARKRYSPSSCSYGGNHSNEDNTPLATLQNEEREGIWNGISSLPPHLAYVQTARMYSRPDNETAKVMGVSTRSVQKYA